MGRRVILTPKIARMYTLSLSLSLSVQSSNYLVFLNTPFVYPSLALHPPVPLCRSTVPLSVSLFACVGGSVSQCGVMKGGLAVLIVEGINKHLYLPTPSLTHTHTHTHPPLLSLL